MRHPLRIDASQTKHEHGNSRAAVTAEILAPHGPGGLDHIVVPQCPAKDRHDAIDQPLVIEQRRCSLGVFDDRFGSTIALCDGFGFADDGFLEVLADIFAVAANCQLQMATVPDDQIRRGNTVGTFLGVIRLLCVSHPGDWSKLCRRVAVLCFAGWLAASARIAKTKISFKWDVEMGIVWDPLSGEAGS